MSLKIEYLINGVSFSTLGVRVENADGLFSRPQRKIAYRHSWGEISGHDVGLEQLALEPRIITLSCFMAGKSIAELNTRLQMFLNTIDAFGYRQITIKITEQDAKALSYMLYREDEINIEKRFRNGENVWRFSLRLIEPAPHKAIYGFTGNVLNLTLNVAREVHIMYGDGGYKKISVGAGVDAGRTYQVGGFYVIGIFAYNPADFAVSNTNATLIWNM